MTDRHPLILKGLNQENEGKVFEVAHQLLVGRSRKCDILLEDGLVSRSHALFEVRENQAVVTDLSSRNGTYVNQERIREVALSTGDCVRIGRSEFLCVEYEPHEEREFEVVDDSQRAFNSPILKKALTVPPIRVTDSFLVHERRHTSGERDSSSGSIAKTELSEESIQGPQWFEILFQVNQLIQTEPDPKKMSAAVSDLLLTVLDGDRCLIALYDEDEELSLYSVRDAHQGTYPYPVKISKAIAHQVTKERCALNVNDIRQDKRFEESDSLLLSKIRSLLVAPIMIGNRVLGLLEISRSNTINAFSEAGLELLSVSGSMMGAALNHVEQIRKQEEYIQELKETHKQLRLAQEDLVRSQQLAIVGRMASSINHEIGNLLMPLLEYHAEDQEEDDIDEAFELFTPEELSYSCTQIKSLIEDIKFFSRGTDRRPEMSRSSLSEQVSKATQFVQIDRNLFPPSGPNKLLLTIDIKSHPKVIMDPLQIGRVIINLLRNAAQAVYGQETPPEIIVRVDSNIDQAIIEIEDNGPGIPEEIRTQLFEPFISTKGDQGLGLGLDISRKIVQNHGGSIEFTVKDEGGTTFKINLPLNPTIKQTAPKEFSLPATPTMSEDF
jgi:signal transduction histidine kinase/pSer/pThr/pTyr-binding forkhead associated (FHA) protein